MSEKPRRGFASMDPVKRREIASKGGKAAHGSGKAHKFTPEEGAAAGKIGGRSVSQDREHMAAIGQKGGRARSTIQMPGPPPELKPGSPVEVPASREDANEQVTDEPRPPSGQPPLRPDAPAPSEGPLRVLLENGPFAGCTIHLDLATRIPDRLWLDRMGVVIGTSPLPGEGPSGWVGLVAVPVPQLEPDGDPEGSARFEYERTAEPSQGFDGVLRFVLDSASTW